MIPIKVGRRDFAGGEAVRGDALLFVRSRSFQTHYKNQEMTRTLCCFSEEFMRHLIVFVSQPSCSYSHSTHSANLLFPVHSSSSSANTSSSQTQFQRRVEMCVVFRLLETRLAPRSRNCYLTYSQSNAGSAFSTDCVCDAELRESIGIEKRT